MELRNLYTNGVCTLDDVFQDDFVNKMSIAKNNLFSKFPYGQFKDSSIIKKEEDAKNGCYAIVNALEKESVFVDIFSNEKIKNFIETVLGKNFQIAEFVIRKIPPISNTKLEETYLDAHVDWRGGLSFSILLDDIKEGEGETFFYKGSQYYPPPNFSKIDKKTASNSISANGKMGTIYFWKTDCWHGRNINSNPDSTTILICHLQNQSFFQKKNSLVHNYDRIKYIYLKDCKLSNNSHEKKNFFKGLLNYFFSFIGDSPNSLVKNIVYSLLVYKFKFYFKNGNTIYTRSLNKKFYKNDFSLTCFLSKISFYKTCKKFFVDFLIFILGRHIYEKIKNKFLKNIKNKKGEDKDYLL
jgi:hypothetical protein